MSINNYCINATGTSNYHYINSGYYEDYLRDYHKYDAFSIFGEGGEFCKRFTHYNSPYLEKKDIFYYENDIKNQKMIPISMGVYKFSEFVEDTIFKNIYLKIPQTGFCAFFKIYQKWE